MPGTDFHAVVNRRIAVTPIHLDLTGRRLLRRLKTWSWTLDPGTAPKTKAQKPPGRDKPLEAAREKKLAEEPKRERR